MQYIVIPIFIALFIAALYFLFRKKEPAVDVNDEFPSNWKKILEQEVAFYRELSSEADKIRFEKGIINFLNKVTVTGVETEITETDKLLVASSAVIPLFGFPGWSFRNLDEVLLYKTTFNQDYETEGNERNILGMVGEGAMNRMMILSKPELYRGFQNKNSRQNVGIHEFVHLLDKADGKVDGLPKILLKSEYLKPWLKLVHKEIQAIHENESDINPYAAKSEIEFLSVV